MTVGLKHYLLLFLCGLVTDIFSPNQLFAQVLRSPTTDVLSADARKDCLEKFFDEKGNPTKYTRNLVQSISIGADGFAASGNFARAEAFQRTYKKPLPQGQGVLLSPTREIASLPTAAQTLWRLGNEGMEQGLEVKAITSLRQLSENYPEFILGHLKLAEAGLRWNKLDVATSALEAAHGNYPDRLDVLQKLIEVYLKQGMLIEAAVASRQFAVNNPDHPESKKFLAQAKEYSQKFQNDLRSEFTGAAIAATLLGKDRSALEAVLAGEVNYGRMAGANYLARYGLFPNETVQNYVKGIASKIWKNSARDDLKYEIAVINSSASNAVAFPGGLIFVHLGLLLDVESEAELAGVIAHEIAHAELSHGFLKVATFAKASIFRQFSLIDRTFNILEPEFRYSREHERQADMLGTRLLALAGYSADGLYNLLGRWAEREGGRRTAWRDTHPSSRDRTEYIATIIANRNYRVYGIEGLESHGRILQELCGTELPKTPVVAANQPQKNPVAANVAPSRNTPKKPFVGLAKLDSSLNRQNVLLSITGAEVKRTGSYVLKLEIKNASDQPFGFIPFYVSVYTQDQKQVKTRFSLEKGKQPTIQPQETVQADLELFGVKWKETGSQNLILELKETTLGGRVFRLSF